MIHRDSGGVQIVENGQAAWLSTPDWRIAEQPSVVIGSTMHVVGDPNRPNEATAADIPFGTIRSIDVLPTGDIVVGDGASAEIMVFDSLGGLRTRFGGRGDGPGKLTDIMDVRVCRHDSIVVASRFDIAVFDKQGDVGRSGPYRTGNAFNSFQDISANCELVLIQQRLSMPPLGAWGLAEDLLAWVDPVGGTLDTILIGHFLESWTRAPFLALLGRSPSHGAPCPPPMRMTAKSWWLDLGGRRKYRSFLPEVNCGR